MAMPPLRSCVASIWSTVVPSFEIRSCTDCCAPLPIATIAITAATPMTMPSIVRSDRSLLARNAASAIRKTSNEITGSGLFCFRLLPFGGFFLRLGPGRLVFGRDDLPGHRVHVDFVDAGLAGHLELVGVDEVAALTLHLDPIDRAFRDTLLRDLRRCRLRNFRFLRQRGGNVPLVRLLGERHGCGENDGGDAADERCQFHDTLQ